MPESLCWMVTWESAIAALMTDCACARFMPITEGIRGSFDSMAVIVGRNQSTSLYYLEATRSPVGRVPSRVGEAHERSELVLDGFRETPIILGWWAGERTSPRELMARMGRRRS